MYPSIIKNTITNESKIIKDGEEFKQYFPAMKGQPYALEVESFDEAVKIQSITMGGVDITATAKVDDTNFRIESVTGDILITWNS